MRIEARADGSYPELLDSETTSFFCRKMDQLFYFCNLRSSKATRQRSPLIPKNLRVKKKQMMEILEIFGSLLFPWLATYRQNSVRRLVGKNKCYVVSLICMIRGEGG